MRLLKNSLFVLLLLAVLPFGAFSQASSPLNSFPARAPEQEGLSSAVLDSLMQYVARTHQNLHHLTIIRNQHTVLDADFYPYQSIELHDIASVTKSITSLLIGIAIDKGFIHDENEPVLQFFPEITVHSPQLDSLTIKDLLTMRSGFSCGLEGGKEALRDMRKTDDWVQYVFHLPIVSSPGTKWAYCSCNYYVLGEILYRTTHLIPHALAKKYLFAPLGIHGTQWLTNAKGINHGWGDLLLHPADLAKIGQLVLNNGQWQGKQIISAQWLRKSVRPTVQFSAEKGYGYGWWTNARFGGYAEAVGRGQQTLSIIPSKNLVVVMLGGGYNQGMVGHYVLESIQSDKPLPPNPKGDENLKAAIQKAAEAPASQPATVNQNVVQHLNGRTIVFGQNIAEIDSLHFDFINTKRGTVAIYGKYIEGKNPFLLSKSTYAMGSDFYTQRLDSTVQLPVAVQAWGEGENAFVLHFNQFCRINNFFFHFKVEGDSLHTTLEETTNPIKVSIGSQLK